MSRTKIAVISIESPVEFKLSGYKLDVKYRTLLYSSKTDRFKLCLAFSHKIRIDVFEKVLNDGRMRYRGTIMAEKVKAGESLISAVRRGLKEELNGIVEDESDIESLDLMPFRESETRYSISYPGLESVYEIFEASAVVPKLPSGEFSTSEDHYGSPIKEIFWTWHDTRLQSIPRGKSYPKAKKGYDLKKSDVSSVAGVSNLRTFLLGAWSFRRTFINRRDETEAHMNGEASFVPAEAFNFYYEEDKNAYYTRSDGREGAGSCGMSQQMLHPLRPAETHASEQGWEKMGASKVHSSALLYTETGRLSVNGILLNTTRKLAYKFPDG